MDGTLTDPPLTDAEFAAALDPLLTDIPGPLAVAVSGGRDSLALLRLTAAWARPRGRALLALTVDHGLRAASRAEAQAVADAAAALNLPHQILTWRRPGAARGNLEAQAREARYRLMAEACASAGRAGLLLGHTRDDQAETVLMRLARGSGVDGLSAMAPRTSRLGLTLLRPLLDIPRTRLTARLKAEGVAWCDDPMNDDPGFTRVRLRQASAVLAGAGLTPARLAATARHMARARQALEAATNALMAQAVAAAPEGYGRLGLAPWQAAPREIGLRLLARLLTSIGGMSFPPRFERLERLDAALRSGALGRGRTLGGCRILPSGAGEALILREAADPPPPLPLPAGATRLWDGRFHVRLHAPAPGASPAQVRSLGADGLQALREAAFPLRRSLPTPVRPTLPSLWQADVLIAVPHLGFAAGGHGPQRFEAEFTGFSR